MYIIEGKKILNYYEYIFFPSGISAVTRILGV
jgi:hypothetical protein